jgi:hypothetical protein
MADGRSKPTNRSIDNCKMTKLLITAKNRVEGTGVGITVSVEACEKVLLEGSHVIKTIAHFIV